MKQLPDFATDISVLVSSCDRFFDAWQPFAYFFRKFWPECPFAVYLIGNELRVQSTGIRYIPVGADKGWATNMQQALQRIETPYFLYFQEDYFLTAPVDQAQLASDITYAFEHDVASFSFCDLSLLEPEFGRTKERFAVVSENSRGRTRLQVTLWKREAFAALLRAGETAWDMEARGSERSRGLRIVSYTGRAAAPITYVMSAIVRGLWTDEAVALCAKHHLRIRPGFRSNDANTKRGRRWRRAIDAVRFTFARALQGSRPIDLDSAPDAPHAR